MIWTNAAIVTSLLWGFHLKWRAFMTYDISHDKTHARGGFFDWWYLTHFIVGCTRSQCFQSETRFKHYDLLGYHNWASFLVRDGSWRHLRPYLGRLGIICIEVAGYENRVSADIIVLSSLQWDNGTKLLNQELDLHPMAVKGRPMLNNCACEVYFTMYSRSTLQNCPMTVLV